MRPPFLRMIVGVGPAGFLPALALSVLAASSGCSGTSGHNNDASPVVKADSEQGKKAIAETESLLRLRREQEAKARSRHRNLPEEG